MGSLECRLGALRGTRRPTANPAPPFLANRAVNVVTFLVRTSLQIIAHYFHGVAAATSCHRAAVGASLEAH